MQARRPESVGCMLFAAHRWAGVKSPSWPLAMTRKEDSRCALVSCVDEVPVEVLTRLTDSDEAAKRSVSKSTQVGERSKFADTSEVVGLAILALDLMSC